MKTAWLPAAIAAALAAHPALAERTHDITPNDFFSIQGMSQVQLSADGEQAVWVQSYWDEAADKSLNDLWRVKLGQQKPERLTFSPDKESQPRLDSEGKYLYFLRAEKRGEGKQPPYNGKSQIFRMPLSGGDAVPLTREEQGVKHFELGQDSLWFSTSRSHTEQDAFTAQRSANKGPNYGHGSVDVNPIYSLNLQNFRTELLLDDDKVVWDFDVSPDGKRLARVTTTDNELIFLEGWSHVEVYDIESDTNTVLEDSAWREQAPSPYGWLMHPKWSPDGDKLAWRIDYDGHPGQLFVAAIGDDNQVQWQLDLERPGKATLNGSDSLWRPNSDELCYRGAEQGSVKIFCTDIDDGKQGRTRTLTDGDYVVGSYAFDGRGKTMVMSHNSLDHFYDLYQGKVGKTPHRITNINPQTDNWKLPQISRFQWTAPDGSQVEGMLELPPGYKKSDGPLPLVVQIHGGPTAATPYALQHRSYGRASFAAKGWALLSPNYRGSTGYGDKFLVELVGHEHDIEVKDIEAGVDALIKEGIADADKLAVMGWSNGGYLTNALISTTTRYKAASSGAGVFDQRLQWLLEDTPGHVLNYMEGLPWEKPEAYTHGSSLTHAGSITTPTLIHMGENDPRVPAPHAKGLYRTLRHYLDVPTELVIYPGEGHGLSKMSHRKTKMSWDLAWFEHYVLGKELK
ncbi:S9 family peptidase [Ferrimonas sp. SCSIO 43195]|uniref:S9 family peptidase n=1 Tax=Ferrimonas sp. SCSIO 43195 TaxID=2822844 RepID=UPI002075160C|nr:S9 family peptidase [Ferrimonas sp. SCSIO 43195]USD37391.1 S9 family peptidase [Ferrimonas sp. SCSIO 43195]